MALQTARSVNHYVNQVTFGFTAAQLMTPEDALKLARQVSELHEEPAARNQGSQGEKPEDSALGTADEATLQPPPFLHGREIADANRVINLIASGRNPFSDEPFEKLRPEHRDAVLQALCIIASALAETVHRPIPEPGSSATPVSNVAPAGIHDPSSMRPLEEYLQGVEREAIVAALVETNYNRTAAAKLLGITFRSLRYRMESLGLGE